MTQVARKLVFCAGQRQSKKLPEKKQFFNHFIKEPFRLLFGLDRFYVHCGFFYSAKFVAVCGRLAQSRWRGRAAPINSLPMGFAVCTFAVGIAAHLQFVKGSNAVRQWIAVLIASIPDDRKNIESDVGRLRIELAHQSSGQGKDF